MSETENPTTQELVKRYLEYQMATEPQRFATILLDMLAERDFACIRIRWDTEEDASPQPTTDNRT